MGNGGCSTLKRLGTSTSEHTGLRRNIHNAAPYNVAGGARLGLAWLGLVRLGEAGKARLGLAWLGLARLGLVWQARPGEAGHG